MTRPMSDEEIAKRCGLKVSDVRAVLNKLHEYGITSYIRERDKDTGWFSYNWTVDMVKLHEMMEKKQEKTDRMDQEALAYEKSYSFYACKNPECSHSKQRIPESNAIMTSYVCNGCGGNLHLFDNTEIIKSIEERLSKRVSSDDTFIKVIRAPRAKPLKRKPMGKPSLRKARASKAITKKKAKAKPKASRRKHSNVRNRRGKAKKNRRS